MSLISSLKTASAVTGPGYLNTDRGYSNQNLPAVEPAQRERQLTQELDQKLTSQIVRIRKQLISASSSDSPPAEGSLLDIRA